MSSHPALILIVSHAPSGMGLLSALRDILPADLTESIMAFDINLDDDPDNMTNEALKLIHTRPIEKVLMLTDLVGATPYNIARRILHQLPHKNGALISGISLPMLVKVANYQHLPLEKWVAEITDCALEWIIIEFKRNHLL